MSDEQKTGATERKGGEGLRACETCRYIDNMESGMNEPCLTCQRVGNYYLWSEDVPTRAADDNGRDYKIKALERMRVELSDAHVLNQDQAAEIGRLTVENKRINDLCQSANAELLDERLKDSPTNDRTYEE